MPTKTTCGGNVVWITEYEVREINKDGDCIDVNHYETHWSAKRSAEQLVDEHGAIASVVEKHTARHPHRGTPDRYLVIATFGDKTALENGGWIDEEAAQRTSTSPSIRFRQSTRSTEITMNKINTTVTESDVLDARRERKSASAIAKEILESLELGVPFSATFIDGIPMANKQKVEAQLKKTFELWANSWIAPKCRAIIAKSEEVK